MFLDRFLFKLSCKNNHTQKHRHTHAHTHTDAHKDSNKVLYSCLLQKRNYSKLVQKEILLNMEEKAKACLYYLFFLKIIGIHLILLVMLQGLLSFFPLK